MEQQKQPPATVSSADTSQLTYTQYDPALESTYLPSIRALISKDLSEPYSIYVYRYFLYQWGDLCFMCLQNGSSESTSTSSNPDGSTTTTTTTDATTSTHTSSPSTPTSDPNPQPPLIGIIISKLEPHRSGTLRGYIAMLAVSSSFRNRGIASHLVSLAISAMQSRGADEIVLETEVDNTASLKLYERLGFLRSKRLHRYYLNGNAAFRLILYLKEGVPGRSRHVEGEAEGEEDVDGMGRLGLVGVGDVGLVT